MTGSGTQTDPYKIYDATDLQAMQDDLDAYYELANIIDASATSGWNGGLGFDPIGDATTPFIGHFDGKNYTVTSLYINRATPSNGLFGRTGSGTTISNVGLIDCVIISTDGYIGSLVGYLEYGDATNCYSTGTVTSTVNFIGGLIGTIGANGGEVSKCYSTCTVIGSVTVGGFVGYNRATVSNCYARGSVTGDIEAAGSRVGGFIGQNSGTIINSFSTGTVVGHPNYLGGFCGLDSGTITNCFWDKQTSGMSTSNGGTGKTTTEMKTESTFTDAGWNFTTIWAIASGMNDDYPFFGLGRKVYPTESLTRVTNLIHRWSPGNYTLEIALGEVTSEFGLPQYTDRPIASTPTTEEEKVPYVTPSPFPLPGIIPPTTPDVTTSASLLLALSMLPVTMDEMLHGLTPEEVARRRKVALEALSQGTLSGLIAGAATEKVVEEGKPLWETVWEAMKPW